jgi:hypothetical protein
VQSLDTGVHMGNELGLLDKGMFGSIKRWNELPYRGLNYSAVVTAAFVGHYVGNGVLGNAVRGGNGLNLGAAAAPLVLGAAGALAGYLLPASTLRVMDHFSFVLPNSGSGYSPHFGFRFNTDLGDLGPLQDVGLTANMFYDVHTDKFQGLPGKDDFHLGKSWSVSVHGSF